MDERVKFFLLILAVSEISVHQYIELIKHTQSCGVIKGLFEATTILHDEIHEYIHTEKMKIFWLCCKNKFLSFVPYLNLLKSRFNHCPDSAIQ